jgi:GDP-L-fucose synthase
MLDGTQQESVRCYLQETKPGYVIVAAAKVGGIYANMTQSAAFLYENSAIAQNLIHESYCAGVERLLFLGSTCIYPRMAEQPIVEEALLTGPFEPTNAAYGLAKVLGVQMCRYYNEQYGVKYISAMPCNLYGPGDNYHLKDSHVLPALVRKFYEAKLRGVESITLWGTGSALREFLHVDDLAEAVLFLLNRYEGSQPINIGGMEEVTIAQLASMVAGIVGFEGKIYFDHYHPDGTPRKRADSGKIYAMGWKPRIMLHDGLKEVCARFIQDYPNVKGVLSDEIACESRRS